MFWALVSPFRHTSQPPRLSPSSPLRIFFEQHGARVARHPVLSIVLSVALAVIFSYPFLFLVSSTTSDPVLTNHAWASARPFVLPGTVVPDIGIKQAWIHGSYMEALQSRVLEEGLRIQQELLGPEVNCVTYAENHDGYSQRSQLARSNASRMEMFVHSPLLYWNCSMEAVQQDSDILNTVNRNVFLHSAANITVRWRSVFAGKRFKDHHLAAADALIISLFYDVDSSVGDLWDQRAAKLTAEAKEHGRYAVSFSRGKSTLYEFRYQPMSSTDIFLLAGCYFFAAAYLTVSLRRLRAVKSRFGLVLTVVTQIGISIMSSFTICAILRIQVSHIPREVFPFVVIVIGLENMFRLINAVLATPAERPTTFRIASALGEVGFLSSVAVATDVVILFIIGSLSVPAVREFCVFAAIALAMDFVLHITYFLAVLSVDVRRLELQDSLDKLNLSTEDNGNDDLDSFSKKPAGVIALFDFLFKGGSPLSTRIAGSAIMICFAATLNMHFLENNVTDMVKALAQIANEPRKILRRSSDLTPIAEINPVRSPLTWLRIQDHTTGAEIINAVKPRASRLVAKVYDPLYVVLSGCDRTRSPWSIVNSLDTDILKGHTQAFVLTVVATVAGVTLLMKYLLMKNIPEEIVAKPEAPLLTTQTLYEGHSLDVAMIAASPKGVVASVGLDRRIVVWKLRGNRQTPTKELLRPTCAEHVLWPIVALAVDGTGEWLAIAPRAGRISFYRVNEATFFGSIAVELNGHQPSAFFFAPPTNGGHDSGPRLIILRTNGWLSEVYIKTSEVNHHRICNGVVVSSHGIFTPRLPLRIVAACQKGRIFVTARSAGGGDWHTHQLDLMAPPITSPLVQTGEAYTILPLSALGMVVSSRSCNVDLVDLMTGSVIRSFQTGQFRPSTLRAFHAKRQTCLYCGCPSVLSFSIAYTERDSGMFMMHTFSSTRGRMRDICLRAERDRRERKCTGFESVVETTHWLENIEGWEPININMVVGVRRREPPSDPDQGSSTDDYDTPLPTSAPCSASSSLRRRRKAEKKLCLDDDDEEWEAWTMDANGVVNTYPLVDPDDREYSDEGLLVSRAGPVTKIGHRSVAVGFGNTVKVLLIGNERYEDEDNSDPFQSPSRRIRMHRR